MDTFQWENNASTAMTQTPNIMLGWMADQHDYQKMLTNQHDHQKMYSLTSMVTKRCLTDQHDHQNMFDRPPWSPKDVKLTSCIVLAQQHASNADPAL